MKALLLIGIAAYIAFCGTLYFAGNDKDFSDPFVQVAGNTSPSEPAPAAAPKVSKSGKRAESERPNNASPVRPAKSKPRQTPSPTTWKTSRN